jgi:hypothetical protein
LYFTGPGVGRIRNDRKIKKDRGKLSVSDPKMMIATRAKSHIPKMICVV